MTERKTFKQTVDRVLWKARGVLHWLA